MALANDDTELLSDLEFWKDIKNPINVILHLNEAYRVGTLYGCLIELINGEVSDHVWECFQSNKLWLSLFINYAKLVIKLQLHVILIFLSLFFFFRLKFLVFSLFHLKSSCPMHMFWLYSYFLPFCCKGHFSKHRTMLLLKQEST